MRVSEREGGMRVSESGQGGRHSTHTHTKTAYRRRGHSPRTKRERTQWERADTVIERTRRESGQSGRDGTKRKQTQWERGHEERADTVGVGESGHSARMKREEESGHSTHT